MLRVLAENGVDGSVTVSGWVLVGILTGVIVYQERQKTKLTNIILKLSHAVRDDEPDPLKEPGQ